MKDVNIAPFKFSSHSLKELNTCDARLREIMKRAIKVYDFSVICGFRDETAQNYAYDHKPQLSKFKWPNSKHNRQPSLAVDVAPYPINWDDPVKFTELAIVIKSIANDLCIPLIWGGEWRSVDMPHYELK